MESVFDATRLSPHGMFFMEETGGDHSTSGEDEEHQPSCFALEEELGQAWTGVGAAGPLLREVMPTL